MESTIELKDIFKRLQVKSREIGVNPEIIVNEILDEGLDNYNMVRLADVFHELVDICDYPEVTDAVELKHMVRERRL